MPDWVKLHVGTFSDPKVAAMKPVHQLAWVRLLCWAGQAAADTGYLPESVLHAVPIKRAEVEALTAASLVERNGSGWRIASWDKWQGGLQKQRSANAARQAAWRERQKGGADGTP